jgi:hypothetical protein
MRIKFVLSDHKTIKNSPYDIPYIENHPFSLNYLIYLKSLQFSEQFIKTVRRIRIQHNIPKGGIPISKYLDMFKTDRNYFQNILKSHKSIEKLPKDLKVSVEYKGKTYFPSLILTEIEKDLEVFYPNNSNDSLGGFPKSDIGTIALFNSVLLHSDYQKIDEIYWYPQNFKEGPLPRINIGIFANISKNKLLRYIEANFDKEIKPHLLELPDLYKNQLTEYELEVYEFRFFNPKKSFKEIADILGPETGKKDLIEDNVKKTFHTAKKKLEKTQKVTIS